MRTVPGIHIVGLDNMNDYYDVSIKEYRLAEVEALAAEQSDCIWEVALSYGVWVCRTFGYGVFRIYEQAVEWIDG